jgi:hypothetical protein
LTPLVESIKELAQPQQQMIIDWAEDLIHELRLARRRATVITRQRAKSRTCCPSPSWAYGPCTKVS